MISVGHGEIDPEYTKLDEEFVWYGRMARAAAPAYVSAMETAYGPERTHHSFVVGPPHTLIFPNLFLAEMNVMVVEAAFDRGRDHRLYVPGLPGRGLLRAQ